MIDDARAILNYFFFLTFRKYQVLVWFCPLEALVFSQSDGNRSEVENTSGNVIPEAALLVLKSLFLFISFWLNEQKNTKKSVPEFLYWKIVISKYNQTGSKILPYSNIEARNLKPKRENIFLTSHLLLHWLNLKRVGSSTHWSCKC